MMGFRTPGIKQQQQQQQQQQPRLVYTQAVQNFLFLIILGINLYLFLKFEVYYFTSLYHFNGCIVYDKNDHILSANIHRTRISSILIFFSRICHYLSEIQVSHRIQFQKNKNIDHHIEINSKKNSGRASGVLKYVA